MIRMPFEILLIKVENPKIKSLEKTEGFLKYSGIFGTVNYS